MSTQPRTPAGTSSGGQFSEQHRREAVVDLTDVDEFTAARTAMAEARENLDRARDELTAAETRLVAVALRSKYPNAHLFTAELTNRHSDDGESYWKVNEILDSNGDVVGAPDGYEMVEGVDIGTLSGACTSAASAWQDSTGWSDEQGYGVFVIDELMSGGAGSDSGWAPGPNLLTAGDRVIFDGVTADVVDTDGGLVCRDRHGYNYKVPKNLSNVLVHQRRGTER